MTTSMTDSDPFDLSGRTVIVAGGAGLIGRSLTEALADRGATAVVADADPDAGERVAEDVEGARFVRTDLTDEASVRDLVEATAEEFAGVDGLVNTAYPRNENYGRRYEDVDVADWRENIDLHLSSYFLPIQAVTEEMLARECPGSIVNVASIYGMQAPNFSIYKDTGMTSPVEYSAIKAAILNLTRYLASYLGEAGIRVNALSPGGVFDDQDERFVDRYERRTPLGRMASPEDLQGAVVYLLSDASAYVTGHNLVVDGGWTIC